MVRELGWPSFGNSTPWAEDWANPYGASHGAKIAQMTKTAVMSDADDQHPAGQPGRLGERAWRGLREDAAHQYLTRGSISALTMSTSRLISTTTRAKNVTMPWTAP